MSASGLQAIAETIYRVESTKSTSRIQHGIKPIFYIDFHDSNQDHLLEISELRRSHLRGYGPWEYLDACLYPSDEAGCAWAHVYEPWLIKIIEPNEIKISRHFLPKQFTAHIYITQRLVFILDGDSVILGDDEYYIGINGLSWSVRDSDIPGSERLIVTPLPGSLSLLGGGTLALIATGYRSRSRNRSRSQVCAVARSAGMRAP